jgi:ABC-type uncharacterized transport system substrate-binding protein
MIANRRSRGRTGNVGFPQAVLEMGEVQTVARTLGIEVALLEIQRAEDIAPAFETLKAQADALYVVGDALIHTNRTRVSSRFRSARDCRQSPGSATLSKPER